MSGQFEFTVGMLGQYDIGEQTVTDPLREDPAARAAYSGNPGFTEGAGEAHPIGSAKTSLLANAEIAEALEAVQLAAENGEQDIPLETLDVDAALEGLKWLRRNMQNDSEVRRTAIDARDGITLRQEQIAHQARAAQKPTRSIPATRAAEGTRQTGKERQQAHHADRKAQFAYVAGHIPERFEDIDFSHLTSMARQLRSRVKADDTITVETNGTFQALIEERVAAYLEDPAILMNDFNGLVAWHVIEKITPDQDFDIVFAYGEKIEASLLEQLRTKAYTDFSDDTIDEWYAVIEDQPGGELYEGSQLTRPQAAQRILSKAGILVNSLYFAADRNPFAFIDRMHAFALKGLASGDPQKAAVAANVLGSCLKHPFPATLLNQAATQMESGSPIQQQALDLCVTLDGLGIAQHVSTGTFDVRQLTSAQANMVATLYPIEPYSGISMRPVRIGSDGGLGAYRQPRSRDVLTQEFKEKSAAGEIDTMYGRIVRRKEAALRSRPEA